MAIESYARAAWSIGWAEVPDAVLEPGAQELCAIVIAWARDCEAIPGVLEQARRAGRATALWHALEARRLALDARYHVRLHTLLGAVAARLAEPIAAAVAVTESVPTGITEDDAATQVATADAVRRQVEELLNSLDGTDLGDAWLGMTAQAGLEGTAEGVMQAGAYLADARGAVLPDFDIRYQQALDALRALGGAPQFSAATWMGRQMHGLAYDLGGTLSGALSDGAGREQLLQIIDDTLGAVNYGDLVLDHAIATAVISGALSQYASEGLASVDMLASPGACDICEPLAGDSPYALNDAPGVPVHPRCRCSIVPHFEGGAGLDPFYVPGLGGETTGMLHWHRLVRETVGCEDPPQVAPAVPTTAD